MDVANDVANDGETDCQEGAKKEVIRWVSEVSVAQEELEMGEQDYWADVWDDVRGGKLDGELVARARREEIEYMKKRGIWEVVPLGECWRRTGKAPVGVRWVDTNKGNEEIPEIRSRLVARDFRCRSDKDRGDLFAATPPLEAERLALSRAATWVRGKDGRQRLRKVMFIDAKKAHLNPRCMEEVFYRVAE